MREVMAAYGDGIAAAAGTSGSRAIHVYPVSNYTCGSKASKPDKDATVAEAMIRLKDKYEREGMRRTVEAILLVNQHDHPHVLLLQRTYGAERLAVVVFHQPKPVLFALGSLPATLAGILSVRYDGLGLEEMRGTSLHGDGVVVHALNHVSIVGS